MKPKKLTADIINEIMENTLSAIQIAKKYKVNVQAIYSYCFRHNIKLPKAKQYDDLVGLKFGRLTVISLSDYKTKQQKKYWVCECICGNKTIVNTDTLKSGKTKSCGCLRDEKIRETGLNNKISELTLNKNTLYHHYMYSAKKRKIAFSLSYRDFYNLTSSNCYYCGIEPKQFYNYKSKQRHLRILFNGIDRINSDIGYEIDNVVSCCKWCNYAKREKSYDEFLAHILRIYEHRIKPNL
jgi:hypothetical protein